MYIYFYLHWRPLASLHKNNPRRSNTGVFRIHFRRTSFYTDGLRPDFKKSVLDGPTPMCSKFFCVEFLSALAAFGGPLKKINLVGPTLRCSEFFCDEIFSALNNNKVDK